MHKLRESRWFQLGAPQFAVGIGLGVALGAALVIMLNLGSNESAIFSVGDRVLLTVPGQTGGGGGFLTGSGVSIEIPREELPLRAADAVAAGWKDPVLCAVGRGRYFKKETGGEQVPYLLMYDNLDSLIGIYQISETDMPEPWMHVEKLEGGGLNIVNFEHWGLFIYMRDPTRACRAAVGGTASSAYTGSIYFGDPVESDPTPVLPPTPTPSPGRLLEASAQKLSSLISLSFTLVHEGDTQKVEGSVKLPDQVTLELDDPAGTDISAPFDFSNLGETLAGIARAMQDPDDTAGTWINNVQSRGVSGTLLGQQLSALIPSAVADVKVTVKMWVDDDEMVRRVRIEGPVTPGDPPEMVRVLDLSDLR